MANRIDSRTGRIVRERDGIQHAELRKRVVRGGKPLDEVFEEIHDELSEAYYGARLANGAHDRATGWSAGASKPFSHPSIAGGRVFDVQRTPTESKALFDRLHALIHARYLTAIHRINISLPVAEQTPREEYDALKFEADGVTVLQWKSDLAQTRIDASKNDPTDPIDFRDPS